MSAISAANFVLDAARTLLRGEESSESLDVFDPTPEEKIINQRRYARLLEHELDRQHLSDVEREDMDTLDRVRNALYND